jgi:hypothetical protein
MADSAAPVLVPVFPFDCPRTFEGDTLKLNLQKQWRNWKRFDVGVEYIAETPTLLPHASSAAQCTETGGLVESPVDAPPPPPVKQEWTVWQKFFRNPAPIKSFPEIRVERFGDIGWWCVRPTNAAGKKTVYIPCDLAHAWLDQVLLEEQLAWSSFVATRAPFIVVESIFGRNFNKDGDDDPDWMKRGMMCLKVRGVTPFALEDVVADVKKDTRLLGLRRDMKAMLNGKHVNVQYNASCDTFYVLDNLGNISHWWSPVLSCAVWDGLDTSSAVLDTAMRRDAVLASLESIDWDDKSRSENEKALQRALELLRCPATELPS